MAGSQDRDDGGGIKQIFVLNVNAACNVQSIQESKAMTPCFLHTPNLTNKWNDFKAPLSSSEVINEGEEEDQDLPEGSSGGREATL